MPAGPLRGLVLDGIVAGTGSVLVFLPQILILFLFILALEDSGYLPRAHSCSTGSWERFGLSRPCVHPAALELCVRDSWRHGRTYDSIESRPDRYDHDRAAHDVLRRACPFTHFSLAHSSHKERWAASSTFAGSYCSLCTRLEY